MSLKPSPDAKDPPVSEVTLRPIRWWAVIWVVGVIAILLPVLSTPLIIRSHRNPDQTEAVNNARQIGLALFDFETEYGKFSDSITIDAVKAKTATSLSLGTKTSNDLFRQLIAVGGWRSESMFYAKRKGSKKPDNVILDGEALVRGECGFAYLAGQTSIGNPSRPIFVAPIIPGMDRFDPEIYDGKAIILKMDNSVTLVTIDKNGHALVNGMNVLDPKHPVWGSEEWKLVWPE